ncbi:MAG: TIGR00645 family protein [Saprospiraceae bacterium]|nr:TIGR00645 family protein [Candidatus Defluviibacterium haderslevense]
MSNKFETTLEKIIFASRWLQAPLYAGLIIGGILYTYKFLVELIHLIVHIEEITETALMLGILTLVDITMVANLLIMVIIGGYATFVSRLDLEKEVDKPEWLNKVDAGTLKVKLSGSLVGVSGIHLLQIFINIENKNLEQVTLQIIIHVVFLVSSIALAYTEK